MNDDFVLTADNYFTQEADERFMSVHQYLDFAGHMGQRGCECRAMAKLRGEYEKEKSTAMMVGSYVDSYFEGTLEQFKADNPDVFTQKGELKAAYKQAEKMIARAEKDMTQKALAEAVGISRQTMNAIEQGEFNPTIRLCRAICRVLGKSLDELFGEENEDE